MWITPMEVVIPAFLQQNFYWKAPWGRLATTTGLANMGRVIYNLLYYLYITQAPTGYIFCRSLLLLNFRSRPVQHEEKLHCIELLYI